MRLKADTGGRSGTFRGSDSKLPDMAKSDTISERIGDMLHQSPFLPFDIKTADGDTIHVQHPDFAIRSPIGDTAIVFDRDGHFRIVNLDMVVTLEPRKPPTKKKAKR